MDTAELFAKFLRGALLVGLVVVLGIGLSRAQNAGVVGIQAQLTPVFFPAVSANTCSPTLADIGQGQNTLFISTTTFTGTIDLEWTPSPVTPTSTYFPLTLASYTSDTSTHQLYFGGYYPNLRSCVSSWSHGTVAAWYSAISGPVSTASPGIGTQGPTSPPVCDQNQVFTFASSSLNSLSISPSAPGNSVVICAFSIGFSGTPTSGAISLQFYSVSGCTGTDFVAWSEPTTASTPQLFSVPVPVRNYGSSNVFACFQNTSTTGGTISLSWASVHL
jgi:hypothetical protein